MPQSTKGDFLLRVKGESMIDAGILDGDLVIVQRAQDARNGEIVVALAGDDESVDEATVKTFYREGDRIRLQPENSTHRADLRAARPGDRPCRGGVPGAVDRRVTSLHRTLDQELLALLRGASLECLVCGEFVHARARRASSAPSAAAACRGERVRDGGDGSGAGGADGAATLGVGARNALHGSWSPRCGRRSSL